MSLSASTDTDPALVTLLEAEKRYGRRTVLRVDHFELRRGDSLVITGPNGSGKSTLMRLLSGVSALSSGYIRRSAGFDTLKVCYVPQAGGLQLNLSLWDNLRIWQQLVGDQEPADLATQWYMQGFDLLPFLRVRCGELSGGFQRLAALACALSTRPEGLFVDEPLSGIDATHARVLVRGLAAAMSDLQFLVVTSHASTDFTQATRVLNLSPGGQI